MERRFNPQAWPEGTRVQVRNRFDRGWVGGFVVDEVRPRTDGDPHYRLRRVSDGSVVPDTFSPRELRDEGSAG